MRRWGLIGFPNRGAIDDPREKDEQLIRIYRLTQIFIGAFGESGLAIRIEIAAGGNDNLDVAQSGVGPERATNLKTVAAGHEQVAEHRLRMVRLGHLNTALPLFGFQDAPAIGLENFAHDLAVNRIVVDN